jgi:curved DNA-binding protein CbpA
MARSEALTLFLNSLTRKSYYEILRVPPDSGAPAIKNAFHDFSLLYHPDRHVGADRAVVDVAAEIYKRGVEAYRCLSRQASRERYDRALARGVLRIDSSTPAIDPAPARPPIRTLEDIATTPSGKRHATRADRLIAIGKLDDARVQLVTACQNEPHNAELAERLAALYEALALEPS